MAQNPVGGMLAVDVNMRSAYIQQYNFQIQQTPEGTRCQGWLRWKHRSPSGYGVELQSAGTPARARTTREGHYSRSPERHGRYLSHVRRQVELQLTTSFSRTPVQHDWLPGCVRGLILSMMSKRVPGRRRQRSDAAGPTLSSMRPWRLRVRHPSPVHHFNELGSAPGQGPPV